MLPTLHKRKNKDFNTKIDIFKSCTFMNKGNEK